MDPQHGLKLDLVLRGLWELLKSLNKGIPCYGLTRNFLVGRLGAIWGGFWRRLGGVLGGTLGCLGGVLGRLVTVPGASWGVASWLEKGGQHGSNLVPKTEPKSIKSRSRN